MCIPRITRQSDPVRSQLPSDILAAQRASAAVAAIVPPRPLFAICRRELQVLRHVAHNCVSDLG
eukprot:437133-Lingulodinium_polyedra.AAC.1